ncbi:hypothetical protein C8R44DRAFT_876212 [Mycena epipterygia]|nr:hypothetical protein C8R44DRAFT_876212 [Mycena epipterygia]
MPFDIGSNASSFITIDFRDLIDGHSGENMAASMWETVEKFGLIGQITSFVMDNATDNDTLKLVCYLI